MAGGGGGVWPLAEDSVKITTFFNVDLKGHDRPITYFAPIKYEQTTKRLLKL